jgi:putative transposase
MEMVVQGVSTRKVSAITEELCGTSFSKSTVRARYAPDSIRESAVLTNADWMVITVNVLFIKAREDDQVIMRAALIASGIHSDGMREILGIRIGDSESYTSWEEMFG